MMNAFFDKMVVGLVFMVLATACSTGSVQYCPEGTVPCEGECVNTDVDAAHCGACFQACADGQLCVDGDCTHCVNECADGEKRCASGSNAQYQLCGDPDRDSCKEWEPPQDCPEEHFCDEGECFPSCKDACDGEGIRVCDPAGTEAYLVCGYFGSNICLSLGPKNPCDKGFICQDGACVVSCVAECDEREGIRCTDPPYNGFESCADHDGDGCPEWGGRTPCAAGQTCDLGVCTVDCSDDCAVADRECYDSGYRSCGYHDADSCLDWSAVTDCQDWEICDKDTVTCVPNCSDDCAANGDRRCASSTTYETCGEWDTDPCRDWGILASCAGGEVCVNGACVENCKNECDPQGSRMCQDNSYLVCGQYDGDSCLEWGAPIACQADEFCSNGQCASTCSDECVQDQRECFGGGFRLCGEVGDGDDCLDWLAVTACEAWQICDQRTATCVDNCPAICTAGAKRCVDNTVEFCANYNADPCLEWGLLDTCEAAEICDPVDPACVDDCVHLCAATGDRQCASSTAYEICGEWDGDSCREWGNLQACPANEICSGGFCEATCADECTTASPPTTVCEGTIGWRLCDYLDADECLDLGDINLCAGNEECQAGACVVICTDEAGCSPGASKCGAGNELLTCRADFDSDPCLEWGLDLVCQAPAVCYQDQCMTEPPYAQYVKISKVLYDADGYPDTARSYIEIFGPSDPADPSAYNFENFSIVGIDGADGSEYFRIDLDGYVIPENKHFVVAHPDSAWDPSLIDLYHAELDPQNGPDAVQVRWADQVLDAVAYPGPGAGSPVGGEGDPAPSANYNSTVGVAYCLGRRIDNDTFTYLDTDDNANDFLARTYCDPGDPGYGLRLAKYDVMSNIDATPVMDPVTGSLYVASYDYVEKVASDFSGWIWYDDFVGFKSSPALSPDGNTLYVGNCAGVGNAASGLRAFDTTFSGASPAAVRWTALSGTEVRSSPAVGLDGSIYFGTRGAGLVGLNPDGSNKWVPYAESNWIESSPALGPIGPGGQELVVFGVSASGSGKVVALDTASGAEIWAQSTGGACGSSPAIGSDGTVYITCDDGMLYAFDGATGTPRWAAVLISVDLGGTPASVGGRSPVVVPTTDGDLIYTAAEGTETNLHMVWADGTTLAAHNFGEDLSSVTLTGDGGAMVIHADPATGNAQVSMFGPYGNLEWTDNLGPSNSSAWIVASANAELYQGLGYIYVATYAGLIYVYNWASGLDDAVGSFPKFRADMVNSGRRF